MRKKRYRKVACWLQFFLYALRPDITRYLTIVNDMWQRKKKRGHKSGIFGFWGGVFCLEEIEEGGEREREREC